MQGQPNVSQELPDLELELEAALQGPGKQGEGGTHGASATPAPPKVQHGLGWPAERGEAA